jgi:hypothetical protein
MGISNTNSEAMDQYRSWPFRKAMERNSDDSQAAANESGAVFRCRLKRENKF